jgi:carboxypeptidase C (cathepsin A)
VGRIDTRVSAPRPAAALVPGRAKEADDPALAMGASNVKKSRWIRDYLRDEVGVRTKGDYVALTLDVNFAWDWNPGSPKFEDNLGHDATPGLAELMNKRTGTRLLLLSGYYDLATPVLAQRYALTHAGIPLERTRLRAFAAGHAPYGDDASRAAVSAELHRFIAEGVSSAVPVRKT